MQDAHHAALILHAGNHQDFELRRAAHDRFQQAGARCTRQGQIEQQQFGIGVLVEQLFGAIGVGGREHLRLGVHVEQQHAQRIGDQGMVIDQEDFHVWVRSNSGRWRTIRARSMKRAAGVGNVTAAGAF